MAKLDRRTERTRAALMQAFVAELLNEGYDALTVERVAERANVGRSTFYMHYTGKDDILRHSMARPSSVLAVLVGHDVPAPLIEKQLVHFHEQRRRNHVFFEGPVRKIWTGVVASLIEPRLAKLARQMRVRPILPLPSAAHHIAQAQLALIADWLTQKPSLQAGLVGEALIATTRALVAAHLRANPAAPLLIAGEKLQFREV
jgi:AcrR family transcriptional regulator